MKIFMREIFNMEKNKAKVSIILLMVIYTKVIGKMILKMDQVLLIIQMVILILVSGVKEKKMEKEFINLVKDMSIKVNIKIIKDMALDQFTFQMVLIIMENGQMV